MIDVRKVLNEQPQKRSSAWTNASDEKQQEWNFLPSAILVFGRSLHFLTQKTYLNRQLRAPKTLSIHSWTLDEGH